MFNYGNYFFFLLITWILWSGSLADHVCLFDAPNPNGCDSFCINALRPQLDSLVDQQSQMKTQLQRLEAQLEDRLQDLKKNVLEVHTKLEGQLKTILTKIDNQLVNKILSQQESKAELVGKKIPPGFEQIGSNYLRIVESAQNWTNAAKTCQEMGGYLASFNNVGEMDAVRPKLRRNKVYWLDSSGLDDFLIKQKYCEMLCIGCHTTTSLCYHESYFICQADNET